MAITARKPLAAACLGLAVVFLVDLASAQADGYSGPYNFGRPATPEEAAGGILLMASPFAAYITGHTLEVTGGAGI
jgi:3-oxoacyl-[acyl-carrier protein] reductase